MDQPIFYRCIRPEVRLDELAAWVRAQRLPVIVHRLDRERLTMAGATNAVVVPFGGPLRGEVWVIL